MDSLPVLECFVCWVLVLSLRVTVEAQQEPKELPIIAQFWLEGNQPGLLTSATAAVDSTPNLTCSANTVFAALSVSIGRKKDGAVLGASANSPVVVSLDPLRCEDSGVYFCRAENLQVKKTYNLLIWVLCPPELITKSLPISIDSPFYNGSVGNDLTIKLDILSSPPPNWLSLTTLNTKDVLAYTSKVLNVSDGDNDTDQERYGFEYLPGLPPYGAVEVSIRNLTHGDIGRIFTLVVGNGVGRNLSYTFIVRQAPVQEHLGDMVTKAGPPARSNLNIPALALGVALGAVVLIILGVLAGLLIYRKYGFKSGDVIDMDHSMEITERRSNGNQFATVSLPAQTNSAVFDYSATSRSRNLTFHVKELQQRNLNPSAQQRQQQQQQQQQQKDRLEQSVEEEENFNKDYQPQDRLSRTHGTGESIENPYYVPGVELDRIVLASEILETREANDPEANVYSSVPRNLSVVIDDQGTRNQLHQLSQDAPEADTGRQGQDDPRSDNGMNASTEQSQEKDKEAELSQDTDDGSPKADLYDYTRSPDELMAEAEWKIASGSSGKEVVIPGKRRKFSLPNNDEDIYEF